MTKTISILVLSFLILSQQTRASEPSESSCDFYQSLEAELQCGKEAYLQKWAYPLCTQYLNVEPQLSSALQAWFPKVRLCLQEALKENRNQLTCEKLDGAAIDSHVACYVETGFCELSEADVRQLRHITGKAILTSPLWIETSLKILRQCLQ